MGGDGVAVAVETVRSGHRSRVLSLEELGGWLQLGCVGSGGKGWGRGGGGVQLR